MIGEQVEQYLVQKVIKVGGMGAVYLALDTLLDNPVALKLILSDLNEHPEMATRFVAEAKVLAKLNLLNCPNIPILYRYFIWQGKAVMAMEYVPGETLEEMVRRRGPIPANVSVPLIKQALYGLSFAHRIGVIHRDLKPGNLMLNNEGTLKVIDFGIAKKLEVEAGLTRTNTAVGTPWYMAPEQIMGKPVDARTDIYLMGVVLYELLAGQVPFHADSLYEIHAAHVQKIPEPPTIHYPHIPKQVVDAVMRALQKNPADRFASSEEFMRALPDFSPSLVPVHSADPAPVIATSPPELIPVRPSQTSLVTEPDKQTNDAVAIGGTTLFDALPAAPSGKSNKVLIAGSAFGLLLLIAGGGIWFTLTSGRNKEPGGGSVASSGSVGTPIHEESIPKASPETPPTDIPQPPARKQEPPATEKPKTKEAPADSGSGTEVRPKDTAPSPQPVAGQELSGIWKGTYSDSRSAEKIAVQLNIRESNGKDVVGTLNFNKADNTSGECAVQQSTYSAETQKLKLLFHCNGTAPGYFNTPTTFSGIDPAGSVLSGGRVFGFPTVTADIARK